MIVEIPDREQMLEIRKQTPDYMVPNNQIYAVVLEGYLTPAQCHEIKAMYDFTDAYKVAHCGAVTKEKLPPMHGPLAVVEDLVLGLNKIYWQYDLNEDGVAWLQTYTIGGGYDEHTDSYAGQSRKLTAVVQLSPPVEYAGGYLMLHSWPHITEVPRTQGTVVVFQAHHRHLVEPVENGRRQTINMGFWGPPFK